MADPVRIALPALVDATLVRRYKRFLADVELPDGSMLTVHCPNPGRMTSCWRPGAPCRISHSDNPRRKLAWTLEQVRMDDGWVMVHTGRPNQLMGAALRAGCLEGIDGSSVRPEQRPANMSSRFDFRADGATGLVWIEVKSVTLMTSDHLAAFPDAVTSRGARHLAELSQLIRRGERAVLVFLVGRPGPRTVQPAWDIDPAYAQALVDATREGVEVRAWRCVATQTHLELGQPLEVNAIRGP